MAHFRCFPSQTIGGQRKCFGCFPSLIQVHRDHTLTASAGSAFINVPKCSSRLGSMSPVHSRFLNRILNELSTCSCLVSMVHLTFVPSCFFSPCLWSSDCAVLMMQPSSRCLLIYQSVSVTTCTRLSDFPVSIGCVLSIFLLLEPNFEGNVHLLLNCFHRCVATPADMSVACRYWSMHHDLLTIDLLLPTTAMNVHFRPYWLRSHDPDFFVIADRHSHRRFHSSLLRAGSDYRYKVTEWESFQGDFDHVTLLALCRRKQHSGSKKGAVVGSRRKSLLSAAMRAAQLT